MLITFAEREVLRTITVSATANPVRKCYNAADILLQAKAPKCILGMLLGTLRRNHIADRFLIAGFDAGAVDIAILLIGFIVEPDHGLSERMDVAVDILGLKRVYFLFSVVAYMI